MIFEGIYNHNAIRKYGGEKKELSNVVNYSFLLNLDIILVLVNIYWQPLGDFSRSKPLYGNNTTFDFVISS
jgi:hypothetical protein